MSIIIISGNPVEERLVVKTFVLLSTLTHALAATRWRLRHVGVLPTGPKMMFDALWEDGRHLATISLEWTGASPRMFAERYRWRIVNETCSMGDETTKLYKQFHNAVAPLGIS